jgi:hypothetical protein
MAKSDVIDLEGKIERETPFAVLFHTGDKDTAVWLPHSQIKVDDTGPGDVITITIPEWLAEREGLI